MSLRRIVDARGVERRVYNLRTRWRSARVRRDVPRPLYEAICAAAVARGTIDGSESLERGRRRAGDRLLRDSASTFWLGLGFYGVVLLIQSIANGSVEYINIAIPATALALGLATLCSKRWSWLVRPIRMSSLPLMSPLEWVDDGQMAAAMVVNGRCPSCAYPVDPEKREADGAVVCAECGGAWVVVRRGGALRLGR